MSTFKVSIEQIATSIPHPSADRLDLSTLKGMSFQFVTGRDQFRPGDSVAYFPVDSILPPAMIEILGLTGKLAGKEKNRIKTVRLRGEISMGIVILAPDTDEPFGTDVTERYGVSKWEPEPVPCYNANLIPISTLGLSKYDIEGADRYPDVVELLMDQKVAIFEKLEGMNFSVTSKDGQIYVNQREYTIEPKEGSEHSFWKVAYEQGIIDFATTIAAGCSGPVTVYGEYLGPGSQGNIYKLPKNEVRLFDIKVGSEFMIPHTLNNWCASKRHAAVPALGWDLTLREWLQGRTVQEASNGMSLLNPEVMREGVVITPMVEQRHLLLGRLKLKQRSPSYLAKSDL